MNPADELGRIVDARPVEQIPRRVVLPVVLRAFDPAHAADADDHLESHVERHRLLGVRPIGVEQEPRRRLIGEVDDDRMQHRARPWRVGDEDGGVIAITVIDLTIALRAGVVGEIVGEIVGGDENMPGVLQMADEITLASARLDEVRPRPEVRQERLDRRRWRCIGVLRPTLEGAALTDGCLLWRAYWRAYGRRGRSPVGL
jgi:hypothetical protein